MMDRGEVGALLEECISAAQESTQPSEEDRLNYCSCTDALCEELASLLQEAMDMKWPFAPEKWQYKQSLSASDKTNLSDLVSKHLHQLLAVLKASIVAQEAHTALAVVFLVDRFLYWTDESGQLLKITRLLHKHHPYAPVAPQLVIRQARVYLNSGKLQSAEYILSSLINYSGATGCWVYQSESDRALVQAVSVQVRGMILQKLGLWLQAAELIWASLVGYYTLPQPDKKGIGTSLGILANILVSMNDDDFHTFRTNPDIDLSLLGDRSHRLLSAAQAAKMAVVYSQYTSLYVLTNVATQGTCLLSYSFSVECPIAQRHSFLLQAREAFAIGLLTKAKGELVTSKQELHTFLKAAYSLTVTHKWLGTPRDAVMRATQACQKALATFYDYSKADPKDKDELCAEIMHLVAQAKLLLQVEPFPNSDKASFIPDSYRVIEDTLVNFTLEGFTKVMKRFQKFHASVCETGNESCRKDEPDGGKLCITSIGTTVAFNIDCNAENCKGSKEGPKGEVPQGRGSDSPAVRPPQDPNPCPTTMGSKDSLGSSWHNFSSGSGSPRPSGYTGNIAIKPEANSNDLSFPTTEANEDLSHENKKRDSHDCNLNVTSHQVKVAVHTTSSSNASSGCEKFELLQEGIEAQGTEEGRETDGVGVLLKPSGLEEEAQSLSQLILRTTSSSLGDSFSSGSSWEKISADPNSPTVRKPQPSGVLKAGIGQSSKSPKSDESFFRMETHDPEIPDSANGHIHKNHTSGSELKASSKPRPLESLIIDQNMETEYNSASVEPASKNKLATQHPNLSPSVSKAFEPTDISTESSFEMVEDESVPEKKNPLCSSCSEHSSVATVFPERRYTLSQQDFRALLAGVCHECLLKRLQSDKTQFKFEKYKSAHSALHLKFSKATGLWTAKETCVYIGEKMDMNGSQRMAIWVQFLHQEERLSSYVGKEYLKQKNIQFHLKDVERQMTAQYYVTEFNKSLYNKEVMAQIFFIPSEALLILNGEEIVGCVTVEPYMLGKFVKLTNNTRQVNMTQEATKYGLAFGHFTYLFSGCQEVVVDLQGWVTADGKGLTYLTDPQIHSTRTPQDSSNFAASGLRSFLKDQHGPECNEICQLLKLPPVVI